MEPASLDDGSAAPVGAHVEPQHMGHPRVEPRRERRRPVARHPRPVYRSHRDARRHDERPRNERRRGHTDRARDQRLESPRDRPPTRTAIYTGVITDLTITPHKPGSRVDYEVTLTASDNVARLASLTRYGAKADGGNGSEPWTARLDRLIKSAPELTYRIHDTATQTVPPTVWETSLAKHLDALTASVLGSWTVERDGTVSIRIARPRSAAITLTDAEESAITSGIWSYTDVNVAWASADAVAHVTINNHAAKWDAENSEWTADDTEATVDDPTAAAAWGGSAISINTTLPADAVERTARRYLAAANADPAPSSVSLVAAHDTGPADRGAHMATAAKFDPISAINVEWRGEDARALITQVTHTITPTTWKTRLNLTNNQ